MLLPALPNYAPANYRGTAYQDAFGQTQPLMCLGKVPVDQGVKDLSDVPQRVLDKPTTWRGSVRCRAVLGGLHHIGERTA
jgi:hypothetical protein